MTATVLVTGGSGQVGAALVRLAPPDWTLVAPTRAELDITDDAAVARLVAARPWSAIVNVEVNFDFACVGRRLGVTFISQRHAVPGVVR